MVINDKETTNILVRSLPPTRSLRHGPFMEALRKIEVGESLVITKGEWEELGYKTPFRDFGGFVSSKTYHPRSSLFGRKFSTRRIDDDKKIVIRVL